MSEHRKPSPAPAPTPPASSSREVTAVQPPRNRRNQPPYDWPVVRRALVSAFLNGVRPVNNEFNIIGGRCYIALNGWRRKFEEIDGLTDASLVPGVPRVDQAGGFAVVNVSLSWKLHGTRDLL